MEVQLPLVDQNIQVFTIKHVSSELDDHPCDPLTVDRVVVMESMKELVKTKNKEGNEEFNSSSSTLLMVLSHRKE